MRHSAAVQQKRSSVVWALGRNKRVIRIPCRNVDKLHPTLVSFKWENNNNNSSLLSFPSMWKSVFTELIIMSIDHILTQRQKELVLGQQKTLNGLHDARHSLHPACQPRVVRMKTLSAQARKALQAWSKGKGNIVHLVMYCWMQSKLPWGLSLPTLDR